MDEPRPAQTQHSAAIEVFKYAEPDSLAFDEVGEESGKTLPYQRGEKHAIRFDQHAPTRKVGRFAWR